MFHQIKHKIRVTCQTRNQFDHCNSLICKKCLGHFLLGVVRGHAQDVRAKNVSWDWIQRPLLALNDKRWIKETLPTGIQRMSACSCISSLLDVIPPSTWSWVRGMPLSWFMASSICQQIPNITHETAFLSMSGTKSNENMITFQVMSEIKHVLCLSGTFTSRVWKQTASRAENAMWLLFVNWVNPQMILWHRDLMTEQDLLQQAVWVTEGEFTAPPRNLSPLPSRAGLPVRCVKTRKRRNKVATVGCPDWRSQLLCRRTRKEHDTTVRKMLIVTFSKQRRV